MPSVLWRCWLGGRKGIRPVKTDWWGAGVVVCLERGADLHMAQLMPLSLTVSCFSEIQIGFTFLVPSHPGSPGQRPLNLFARIGMLCTERKTWRCWLGGRKGIRPVKTDWWGAGMCGCDWPSAYHISLVISLALAAALLVKCYVTLLILSQQFAYLLTAVFRHYLHRRRVMNDRILCFDIQLYSSILSLLKSCYTTTTWQCRCQC